MILHGETEVLGENLCQCLFVRPTAHHCENRPGEVFGPKEEEVKGRWKMLKEELRNVYDLQKR
jgi:hypothetical protein